MNRIYRTVHLENAAALENKQKKPGWTHTSAHTHTPLAHKHCRRKGPSGCVESKAFCAVSSLVRFFFCRQPSNWIKEAAGREESGWRCKGREEREKKNGGGT